MSNTTGTRISANTAIGKSPGPTSTTRPLPPGTVLGPDGKPCKICTSFRNWKPPTSTNTKPSTTPVTAGKKSGEGVGGAAHSVASATALAASAAAATTTTTTTGTADQCPPDVESLGRATWTFLHTTAAYYPDNPTPTQRAHMLQLLHALPRLYPCSHCADDLGTRMRRRPPDVRSRLALSAWLCATHNEVNVSLGKPTFDCARVDERWRDGPSDGSCD
jgi:FAD-linked sulfhydryl oxidase